MSIDNLKSKLPDFAKDIRLNLTSVLTEEGATDLSLSQIYGIALACAYSLGAIEISEALISENDDGLVTAEIKEAAKASATIMAMNNIYYRFSHLVEDQEISKLPAKLRMNVIANPGISKVDFELMSLAVSAINGCGLCMQSHAKHLIELGISKTGVQSSIRIASVINAVNTTLLIA